MALVREIFLEQFERFKRLIEFNGNGDPFVSFQEGVAGVWESYKPRLRQRALAILDTSSWSEEQIGSGDILEHAIDAIEIDNRRHSEPNNLVFWQNRYGHANRAHRAFLEARGNGNLRQHIERHLYGLYRGGAEEGLTFDSLAELTYGRYPLLAYLYFLKDMERFMPILPTTFDRAFRSLGIDLVTVGNCSWENYTHFNAALGDVRNALRDHAEISEVRLVDAHSFCWMLERLDEPHAGEVGSRRRKGQDPGRKFGAREISINEMVRNTVDRTRNSHGQTVVRTVKAVDLRMTEAQLRELVEALVARQEERCALTGLPFQYRGAHDDGNMLPSLDRIDSNGHYEEGNLQVVCRFVNFWKQDTDNEEFKRLLMLVRGLEE